MSKKQADFSDMSEVDVVRLVANTALVAKASFPTIRVTVAKIRSVVGIMIFMPGYREVNGEIVANNEGER